MPSKIFNSGECQKIEKLISRQNIFVHRDRGERLDKIFLILMLKFFSKSMKSMELGELF
jgi:hypothetical protein